MRIMSKLLIRCAVIAPKQADPISNQLAGLMSNLRAVVHHPRACSFRNLAGSRDLVRASGAAPSGMGAKPSHPDEASDLIDAMRAHRCRELDGSDIADMHGGRVHLKNPAHGISILSRAQ